MEVNFIYSLIAGVFIGGAAGYLGSLMITKRMALVGDALGHVALPGIALALTYGFNVSLGALPALAFGIILIWLFEIRTKLPLEALTGIAFTASVAVAFLFLPEEEVSVALIGDISHVNIQEVLVVAVLCIIVIWVLRKIYDKMILVSLSENLAQVEHVKVNLYNFIYLVCIAIVVALGIKVTGSLLMGALVITPAAIARNLAHNLFQYSYGAMVIGSLCCVVGILLFQFLSIPAGPLIILTATLFFIISLIFKSK